MYFPKRLLLSFRVVFAFPIACRAKRRIGMSQYLRRVRLKEQPNADDVLMIEVCELLEVKRHLLFFKDPQVHNGETEVS